MLGGEYNSQNSGSSDICEELAFAEAIKVLLVDHNAEILASLGDFLVSYSFEVTCVNHAGSALEILSVKEDEFDVVLLDSQLTDVDTHAFLRLTKNMELIKVVMSEELNNVVLSKAFKNGAFMVVRKLLTIDILEQIRQHVIRNRITKLENDSHSSKRKAREEPRKNVRKSSEDKDLDFQSPESDGTAIKKKVCMEWTEELHAKFMDAVSRLGEGRCYPNEILELMNVPGLTRMQVASHLQKCRNDRWKGSEKRKEPSSSSNPVCSSNPRRKRLDTIKFGTMPLVEKELNRTQESNSPICDFNLPRKGKEKDVNVMNPQTSKGLPLIETSAIQNIGGDIGIEAYPQQNSFSITSGQSTGDYYVPASFDFPDLTQASNYQANLPNERQPGDDFLDLLKNMDDTTPSLNSQPGGPTAYQVSVSEEFASLYDQIMPTQDSNVHNRNVRHQR